MSPTLSFNMLFPDHIGNPLNLDLISAKSTHDFLSKFAILPFCHFFAWVILFSCIFTQTSSNVLLCASGGQGSLKIRDETGGSASRMGAYCSLCHRLLHDVRIVPSP